jgi:large conductance mechanosensitive channel
MGGLHMLEEFKKFALRGNVVDLAVGVIIGAAFGAIVTSIVADVIMPVIGAITGGLDFSNYYLPLSSKVQSGVSYADAKKTGAVLGYGQFITVALNFIIVAFVLFLVIRAMNQLMRKEEAKADVAKPAELPADVKLLAEIRDQMTALNKVVAARAGL